MLMGNVVRIYVGLVAALFLLLAFAGKAMAEEHNSATRPVAPTARIAPAIINEKGEKEITLTLKDHIFDYDTVEVKSSEKFVLVVKNDDDAAEEFESRALKKEKIIPAKSSIRFSFDSLKAGVYAFVGEFHEDKAKGQIIVKE